MQGPHKPGLSKREQKPEPSCSWSEGQAAEGAQWVFLLSLPGPALPNLTLQMVASTSRSVVDYCISTLSTPSLGAQTHHRAWPYTVPCQVSSQETSFPEVPLALISHLSHTAEGFPLRSCHGDPVQPGLHSGDLRSLLLPRVEWQVDP